jgi:molecular chaperone DnaK (HSP70)
MSNLERNIGIDFGTSTTVVCYLDLREGRPESNEPLFVNWGERETNLLPSLIYEPRGGKPVFGRNAKDAHRNAGDAKTEAPRRGTLVQNLKMDLVVPEKREIAEKKMAQFFAYLFGRYQDQRFLRSGTRINEQTFVSFPAKWSPPLRELTVRVAQNAGFPNVKGIDEPTAAMQFFLTYETSEIKALRDGGVIVSGQPLVALLIDMGAGTTDFVLFRTTPDEVKGHEVLSTWPQANGANFGGRDVDARLRAYITNYLKRNMIEPEQAEEQVAFFRDEIITHKEDDVSPYLREDRVVDHCAVITTLRQFNLLRADRESYRVDRRTFGSLLRADLQSFVDLVNGLLDDAQNNRMITDSGDIDLVLLTGGNSKWYFVDEMLSGQWVPGLAGAPEDGSGIHLPKIKADPRRIVRSEKPQEIVAQGLTLTGLNGIDIVKRAVNNLWYEVAVGGSKAHLLHVVKRGQTLPNDVTLHQRIPLQRRVAATTIDASVVPLVGPTIQQGHRYAQHAIQCNIASMNILDDRIGVMAREAGIRLGANLSEGLDAASTQVGYLSDRIDKAADKLVASKNSRKSAAMLFKRFAVLLAWLKGSFRIGAKKVKDHTEKIAQERSEVKEDQVDVILKVHVDENERIQYIVALDILSAGQWGMFWHNQDEPNKAEEQLLRAEIKNWRQSR